MTDDAPDARTIRLALEVAEAELPADRYVQTIKPAMDALDSMTSRLAAAERAIERSLALLSEYEEAARRWRQR